MSNRGLIVLVLLGALSLGTGWYFGPGRVPASTHPTEAGTLLFPGLAERLTQARRVEIVHQGKTLVIERRGEAPDATWGLADRDLYPVQTSALRGLLTGLTELRLMEKRTSDPAKFARLGVASPDTPDGTSNLLRVLDSNGKSLAAVVLGHRRVRTQGKLSESVYIRRPDQAQVWLAEGKLAISADPQTLIDRNILSIAPARIVHVVVERGTERLEFVRDGDTMALTVPAGQPLLEPYRLEDVASALDNLTLLEMRRTQEPPASPALGEAIFTAIDGLVVRVTVFRGEKELWARFVVSGPEAIAAELRALGARLDGWEYQISAWKEKALLPTLEDMKATPKDQAPPEIPPAGKP